MRATIILLMRKTCISTGKTLKFLQVKIGGLVGGGYQFWKGGVGKAAGLADDDAR